MVSEKVLVKGLVEGRDSDMDTGWAVELELASDLEAAMVSEVVVSDLEVARAAEVTEEEVVLVWDTVLVSEDVGPKISHESIFPCASLARLWL